MTNIALIGKAGSGKTELAKSIEDTHVKLSFATAVKEASVDIYNLMAEYVGSDSRITLDDLNGSNKRFFRILMQVTGTELGRDLFGHHVWVQKIENAIEFYKKIELPMVVDDVRFPNELSMLAANGFTLIYVERGLDTGDHASEQLDKDNIKELCDQMGADLHIIENDGTIEELVKKFYQIVR